jgi:DNA-binding beta-propeller fold protein YncE
MIPITGSSTTTNTVGSEFGLSSSPNSFLFEPGGTAAYLGVDSGQLGSRGLMVLTSSSSVTLHTTAPGTVLAVSPDGKTVIVSDTVDVPNQVYVYSSATSTVTATLNITGATAAAFSPDNLKAYIVAKNQLYVYSILDSLKNVQLSSGSPTFVATDVAFLPVGAFAFVAGGPPNTVTPYTTCTNAIATDGSTPQVVPTPGLPSMLRPLPNGTQVLAMDSPVIDYLNVTTAPEGCPPTMSASFGGSVNLGQGNFVPTQFIVSPDGLKAYVVMQNSGTILVYDIANRFTSAITLTGNALALSASLTPDGKFLYVGAEDVPVSATPDTSPAPLGSVHMLDTNSGVDIQQITFPQTPQPFCIGRGTPTQPPPAPVTYCYPDLIAVKP